MGILEAEREQYAAMAVEATKVEAELDVRNIIINLINQGNIEVEKIALIVNRDLAYVQNIKAEMTKSK